MGDTGSKRINVRDVPDDVYDTLVTAAEEQHQSLNAYVLDRLAEAARVARVAEHVRAYSPPADTGVPLSEVVDAVREVREAS